jgi:cell division protein FtsL
MSRAVTEIAIAVVLAAAIIGTGIDLVQTKSKSRALFSELEALRREEDRLQGDWSALQIEVSTLARHSSIDTIARDKLGMVDPGQQLRYVEPAP